MDCWVRHRIDGLEKCHRGWKRRADVRHRIDGLEISIALCCQFVVVRHRIDGLEKFRFSIEDRQGDVDNVQATYHDAKQAKKVTVNTNTDGQKPKRLKGNFKDEKTATAAANAEKKRIEGEQGKFSINCAFGYPAISTESPIELQGFKVEIDSLKWTVDKATHSYSKSQGLTTQLDLTAPINDESR